MNRFRVLPPQLTDKDEDAKDGFFELEMEI